MAGPLGRTVAEEPRLLRATYLAEGETLLRESRATKLFGFPGPIVVLLVLGLLDLGAAAAADPGWPAVPGVTGAFAVVGDVSGAALGYLLDALLLATAGAGLWLLGRYLTWSTTVYAVTTQRVLVQSGIVARDFDEIPMQQIRGVDVHQSAGERLLGFGTIWLSSEGGPSRTGRETWRGIPRPFEWQRIIQAASASFVRAVPPAYR